MTPVAWHPSPNFGPRQGGQRPRLIVLHYTAMASAEAAIERLCDPIHSVSAHYVIAQDGAVTQLVAEGMRAWHAGAGEWQGQGDVNSRSIGIELDNDGKAPFAEPLMRRLERLLDDLMARWEIAADGVIGHSDLAPGRKGDPGPMFDWARLAQVGLAAPTRGTPWTGPVDMTAFVSAARAAGYTENAAPEALLTAVRLRHRPKASGPLTAADFAPLT